MMNGITGFEYSVNYLQNYVIKSPLREVVLFALFFDTVSGAKPRAGLQGFTIFALFEVFFYRIKSF